MVEDRVIIAQDNGVALCIAIESGKVLWKNRLGGNFSASPILAGGNVYVPNEDGKMFVFRPGRRFQIVAQNDLGDGGFASPVFAGGQLFLRTNHYLYCIGGQAAG